MKNICLLSDTHGYLPASACKHLEASDEIWHAGDIGIPDVLEPWKSRKIIRAVRGNIDTLSVGKKYPEILVWEEESMKFLMTHIGGKPGKYPKNVCELFKIHSPQVFICGHSHILRVMYDKQNNLLYLNPGACGREGFHKMKTLLVFELFHGNLRNLNIVELEPRSV